MSEYFDNYEPLFELGIYGEDPAVKVINEFAVCPVALAALTTALFETVMRTLPDDKQIDFEEKFNESFSYLMQERHDYDVTMKYPTDD